MKGYDKPKPHIKKQRHYFSNRGPSSQSYGFSSSHVWIWGLDYKQSWALKNWCFWTVVLEKTLGSPLDCKEMKPVNPKGNQPWVFTGRTDSEDEAPILWPPNAYSLEKTLMLGKTEGRRRRGDRELDCWEASSIQWTWVWASSGSWWWIGKPGVVQSMRLQRVGHNWVTGLKWLQRWYVVLVENFLFIDKQKWNKMKKTINLNLPWGLSSSLGTLAYCSVKIKIR